MSFDDWILALHVVSAFSYVAGIILFWILIIAVRRTDDVDGTLRMQPVAIVGNIAIGVGGGGTIILGIWLALSVGGYDLWDGWIIAASVLGAIAGAVGQRTGAAYTQGVKKARELAASGERGPSAELLALNRTQTGLILQTVATVVLLLLLIDMIWKPGA